MPTFNQLNIYLDKKGDTVILKYALEGKEVQSQERMLQLSVIQDLIGNVADGYYVDALKKSPAETGQQLYHWLDDNDRFIERAIQQCPTDKLLVLAFQGSYEILHLPWELLHNGTEYLVQQYSPQILPVRLKKGNVTRRTAKKQALQLLFMATAPENVPDFLDFEGEEAKIVAATERFNLELEVEESGNLQELQIRYNQMGEASVDVVHLSGHASNRGFPHFMTEDELGYLHKASADDFFDAFTDHKPSLLFLSGCHTGEARKQGATPSLAQALVEKGFPAILAWARPVYDSTASQTAAYLYEALSKGRSIPKAIHTALFNLLKDEKSFPHWHLLRLYANGIIPDKLIEAGNYRKKAKKSQQQFLDPIERKVKVPSKAEFVGRRRKIQACLRTLRKDADKVGVLLQGMGGLGKSSLAARVCDRLESTHKTIVIVGKLEPFDLLKKLSQNLDDAARNIITQQQQNPQEVELTYLLQAIFAQTTEPKQLLIVLDDFEQNFETDEAHNPQLIDNLPRLTPQAADTLQQLIDALNRYEKDDKPPQLIITSRYNFKTQQTHLLEHIPLTRFKEGAWKRFQNRKNLQNLTDPITAKRCLNIADGNPRLLEWLIPILQNTTNTDDQEKLFAQLEAKEQDFRENILADYLLQQQDKSVQNLLKALTPYEIPVPLSLLKQATEQKNIETALQNATNIALIDYYPEFYGNKTPHYRLSAILKKQLPTPTEQDFHKAAVLLSDTWEEIDFQQEAKVIEITKLSIIGKNKEVLETQSITYIHVLLENNRYKDVMLWSNKILPIIPKNPSLLIYLGRTKRIFGEMNEALEILEKANQLTEKKILKSVILSDIGIIHKLKGQTEKALIFFQEAFEISSQIADEKGKASILSSIARISYDEGKIDLALESFNEALEILNNIKTNEDDNYIKKQIANTQHEIAFIYLSKEQLPKALKLYNENLIIYEYLNDQRGIAGTFHDLGIVFFKEENFTQSLKMYNSALTIYKYLGEPFEEANTLNEIAGVLLSQQLIEKAFLKFKESLQISQKIGNIAGIATASHYLGIIQGSKKEYKQALNLIKQAINIFAQIKSPQLVDAQLSLSVIVQEKLKHELSEEKYAILMKKYENRENPEDIKAWLSSEGITF